MMKEYVDNEGFQKKLSVYKKYKMIVLKDRELV